MELAGSNVWLCVIVDQPAAPSTSKIGELNASPPKGRPVFAADGRTLMVAEWVTRAVFRFLAAREVPARQFLSGLSTVTVMSSSPKRHGEWLAENVPGAEVVVLPAGYE